MAARSTSIVRLSALLIGLFQLVGTYGATEGQLDATAVVLVLAGPAALAFRDRWPLVAVAVAVAATDIYVWLGYAYGPIFISLVVAIFSAIQSGRRRSTLLVLAIGYLGFVAISLVDPRVEFRTTLGHFALVAGWLVAIVTVSEIVRIRRQQVAQQERAELEEQERRASEQRLHLAQELHDVLAHNISLINVQASVALHLLDDQPDQARPALTSIKVASREALGELRTALDVLRRGEDAPRLPAPRLADLDSLVDGVRTGGLAVHFDHDEPVLPFPAAVELAAYRIVQEALTNVTRHAGASQVQVSVGYGDGVSIEVVDDGVGGHPGRGDGITGMRRRAAALGGSVEAGPAPAGGFRVAAWLPRSRS